MAHCGWLIELAYRELVGRRPVEPLPVRPAAAIVAALPIDVGRASMEGRPLFETCNAVEPIFTKAPGASWRISGRPARQDGILCLLGRGCVPGSDKEPRDLHAEGCVRLGQANISLTTFPATSVSRKSRPA